MTVLQIIVLVLCGIWFIFEMFHLVLFIRRKIKNKKYEVVEEQGSDEREI